MRFKVKENEKKPTEVSLTSAQLLVSQVTHKMMRSMCVCVSVML